MKPMFYTISETEQVADDDRYFSTLAAAVNAAKALARRARKIEGGENSFGRVHEHRNHDDHRGFCVRRAVA